ncbi:hypothetical protein TRIP_D60012 [uncultured Paludibacter sp.]|nr:hypothetical protein TRIP_D60012 [uncultured Paludibacter sp.]
MEDVSDISDTTSFPYLYLTFAFVGSSVDEIVKVTSSPGLYAALSVFKESLRYEGVGGFTGNSGCITGLVDLQLIIMESIKTSKLIDLIFSIFF